MLKTSLPVIPPLPVPHRRQEQSSDCLAACVAMVLGHAGRSVDYAHLLDVLCIGPLGTLRRNVLNLTRWGLDVTYREATLPIVAEYLQAGFPVIAFVDTAELAYWQTAANHAVVVVGIDAEYVVVDDPAFASAPHFVPHDEFESAWLNCNNACVVVRVPSAQHMPAP